MIAPASPSEGKRRCVDLLLYLSESCSSTDVARLLGALAAQKGCLNAHPCDRGNDRLVQVRHDPALLPCGAIRQLAERTGCRAKIIGL